MRNILLLAGLWIFFSGAAVAQEDSIPAKAAVETIYTAFLNTRQLEIDLANPEEVALALKKVHTLKQLESITLSGETDESTLKKVFYRLSALRNLGSLLLSGNELARMPDNISSLRSLQSITIENNPNLDYETLCKELKPLPLTQLSLIDNDLKRTPQGLSELVRLRKVQVSGGNQLDYTELVEQLSRLPNLTELSIAVSYITDLPKNLDKLRSLQVLDVSENNLTELPDEISRLKAINNLSIQGNLLLDPAKDLAKLKDNNIQYLALDKEIAGEDLEKIRQLFPAAQIDFPVSKEEEDRYESKKLAEEKKEKATEQVHSGELRARKETSVLSAAYLFYPVLFANLAYGFDTLNFDERYNDLRYSNVYRTITTRGNPNMAGFCFRRYRLPGEKKGRRHEKWFRMTTNYREVNMNYPELRAFLGMYWVYTGDLKWRQFQRKFISSRQGWNGWLRLRRKARQPVWWNDIRVNFDKYSSQFTIQLKSDSGFVEFPAYPRVAGIPLERSQDTYNRRYMMYQRSLLRRAQRFKNEQARSRARYDANYRRMREYAWKELQTRMSSDEKAMGMEEWLLYYDEIVANEQKAIDNAPPVPVYINRAFVIRGYQVNTLGINDVNPLSRNAAGNYGTRLFNVDFTDAKSGGKLAVTTILVVDNKNKSVSQLSGTLGLAPNAISLRQFSSTTLLVQLRNGNWGTVDAHEIDKQSFDPNKTYKFSTQVFDRNLSTIGELLKSGIE